MATKWFSAAENLLNAVDSAVMKTVAGQQQQTQGDGSSTPPAPSAQQVSNGSRPPSSHGPDKQEAAGWPQPVPYHPPPQPTIADTGSSVDAKPISQPAAPSQPTTTLPPTTSTPQPEETKDAPGLQKRPSDVIPAPRTSDSAASTQAAPAPSLPASMAVVSSKRAEPVPAIPAPTQSVDGGAVSSTREQQLMRVIEQLKERLKSKQVESEQLEDLLAQAEARCEREKALITQLQGELSTATTSKTSMESALHAQLSQQAIALQEAQLRADTASRQVLALESQLAVATENSRSLLQNKSDIEGGMLQALRSQLAAVESELDGERRAHTATRQAALARERELETSQSDQVEHMAQLQRSVEQEKDRVRDLEDELASARRREMDLEKALAQHSAQQREDTHDSETAQRNAQEVHDLRAELQQQRDVLQRASAARLAAETEAKTLQSEIEILRASADQDVWRRKAAQLETSLREAHDLLYSKQATIEQLNADRSTLQLRLERETAARNRAQTDHAINVDTHSKPALALTGMDSPVVPTNTVLGERYRKLASRQDNLGSFLQGTTSLIDKTASVISHALRQYPWVRIVAGSYLLLLHLYVYVLTLSLQHRAVVLDDKSKPH